MTKVSSSNVFHKFTEKIKQYLSFDQKLRFNFSRFFYFIFESLLKEGFSQKFNLLKISKNKILYRLDIHEILNKFQEIEKIKNLLFSQDQLNLLNFSPKQTILTDEEKKLKIQDKKYVVRLKSLKRLANFDNNGYKKPGLGPIQEFKDLKSFKKLIDSWKRIKNSNKNTEIDERLISIFGTEFISMLDLDKKTINELDEILEKTPKSEDNKKEINKIIKTNNPGKLRSPSGIKDNKNIVKPSEIEKDVSYFENVLDKGNHKVDKRWCFKIHEKP